MTTTSKDFEKTWTITEIWPGEEKEAFTRLPMEVGDTLTIQFESATEARFDRKPGGEGESDSGWSCARGIFFGISGKILGELEHPEKGITTFTISLSAGKENIRGEHRYNPDSGGWGGHN